jgi:hypothetical protein
MLQGPQDVADRVHRPVLGVGQPNGQSLLESQRHVGHGERIQPEVEQQHVRRFGLPGGTGLHQEIDHHLVEGGFPLGSHGIEL